jgi:hypothetical protein
MGVRSFEEKSGQDGHVISSQLARIDHLCKK